MYTSEKSFVDSKKSSMYGKCTRLSDKCIDVTSCVTSCVTSLPAVRCKLKEIEGRQSRHH